jgi:hypothetical protein
MTLSIYAYSVSNTRFGHSDFHHKRLLEIANLRTHLERKRQTDLIQNAGAIIKEELMQTAVEAAYLVILRQYQPDLKAEELTRGFIQHYNIIVSLLAQELKNNNTINKKHDAYLRDVTKVYKALEPFRSSTANDTLKLVKSLAKTLHSLETMSFEMIFRSCSRFRDLKTDDRPLYGPERFKN